MNDTQKGSLNIDTQYCLNSKKIACIQWMKPARFIGDTPGRFKPTHKQTGKKSDTDSSFN